MAQVKDATLRTSGSGEALRFLVDVEIDGERGDDRVDWEIQIRFFGADALLTGRDDALVVHAVPWRPEDGDRRTIEVSGADGRFDEDRGEDEVRATVELVARTTDARVVETNTVTGDFSGA